MEFKADISGLDELERQIEKTYMERLADAGEKAVHESILRGNYQNQTGNLRSSIGYVIAYNGKILREGGFYKIRGKGENSQKVEFTTKDGKRVSFWAKGQFGDGSEGSRIGVEFARSLVRETTGYAFFLVAGMEYASYVSSKGYDVIDSGTLLLWRLIGK